MWLGVLLVMLGKRWLEVLLVVEKRGRGRRKHRLGHVCGHGRGEAAEVVLKGGLRVLLVVLEGSKDRRRQRCSHGVVVSRGWLGVLLAVLKSSAGRLVVLLVMVEGGK